MKIVTDDSEHVVRSISEDLPGIVGINQSADAGDNSMHWTISAEVDPQALVRNMRERGTTLVVGDDGGLGAVAARATYVDTDEIVAACATDAAAFALSMAADCIMQAVLAFVPVGDVDKVVGVCDLFRDTRDAMVRHGHITIEEVTPPEGDDDDDSDAGGG